MYKYGRLPRVIVTWWKSWMRMVKYTDGPGVLATLWVQVSIGGGNVQPQVPSLNHEEKNSHS